MRIGAFLLAALVAFAPRGAEARSHRENETTNTRHREHGHHHRLERDPAQRRTFMHEQPCPGGRDRGSTQRCHGYVVDHIKPLKHGGADRPWNMQWQTTAESKAKDRWE